MPKKRNSTESDNNEQANESSGSLSQNEDNAKRAKLDILSDTTLQDLPIELLEMILVKVVVMEVKDTKLAKCAWKEKVDPVISRLKQVCSQWHNILTSNYFPISLDSTLDDTAEETTRLEVLNQSSVNSPVQAMTRLGDEIFTACKLREKQYAINVYDRDNMEVVKDVIPLPKSCVMSMAACKASNCVYVGLRAEDLHIPLSVLRIWRDAEHKFNQSKWEHENGRPIYMISVTASGGLLTFSIGNAWNPAIVTVYDANGSLQHEVLLPQCAGDYTYIIQKSNGNLVLSYDDEQTISTNLLEIDTTGRVVRRYDSQAMPQSRLNFADCYGRIMITETEPLEGIELLDSEFNPLDFYTLEQDTDKSLCLYDLNFNDDQRNEILRSHYDRNTKENVITTYRFTEE